MLRLHARCVPSLWPRIAKGSRPRCGHPGQRRGTSRRDRRAARASLWRSISLVVLIQRVLHQMQRLDVSERVRAALVIDETQNVITPSFATLLSEGRSGGLEVGAAFQYTGQIKDERVRMGVRSLLQNLSIFRQRDLEDARAAAGLALEVFQDSIGGEVQDQRRIRIDPMDIVNQPDHRAVNLWLAHGAPQPVFTAQPGPPGGQAGQPPRSMWTVRWHVITGSMMLRTQRRLDVAALIVRGRELPLLKPADAARVGPGEQTRRAGGCDCCTAPGTWTGFGRPPQSARMSGSTASPPGPSGRSPNMVSCRRGLPAAGAAQHQLRRTRPAAQRADPAHRPGSHQAREGRAARERAGSAQRAIAYDLSQLFQMPRS